MGVIVDILTLLIQELGRYKMAEDINQTSQGKKNWLIWILILVGILIFVIVGLLIYSSFGDETKSPSSVVDNQSFFTEEENEFFDDSNPDEPLPTDDDIPSDEDLT